MFRTGELIQVNALPIEPPSLIREHIACSHLSVCLPSMSDPQTYEHSVISPEPFWRLGMAASKHAPRNRELVEIGTSKRPSAGSGKKWLEACKYIELGSCLELKAKSTRLSIENELPMSRTCPT
ncbi:hypothetical protein J6590_061471 [Homalodisca vitripennis]|nr:hypothetical protein J6590_061471 [Homalodisca vitripennis]